MKTSKPRGSVSKSQIIAGSQKWSSDFFRADKIDKALNLAVRGVPASWLPDERPVDLAGAREWYAPEISLLDALSPRKQLFTSGLLGAALMSLCKDPGTIDFWARFNAGEWVRHEDGRIDPVGWLLIASNRHTGYKLITLRTDYQHLDFQNALAAVFFDADCRREGVEAWLTSAPPLVSIPDLVDTVRQTKAIRRSPDGFRPKSVLRGRIPRLLPATITHRPNGKVIRQISRRMCQLAGIPCSRRSHRRVLRLVRDMAIPQELAAPGALAAAVSTILQDPQNEAIWRDAFADRWSHIPGQGSTVAGQLVQAIRRHNRRPQELEGELELAARCKMAIQSHHRLRRTHPEPRLKNLPRRASGAYKELRRACSGLRLKTGPDIHMGYIEPFSQRRSNGAKRCNRQQKRGKTGKRAEKIFERIHAEFAWPRPGLLIDRTSDQCGYDYGIVERSDEDEWVIEVKTVKPGEQISMTKPQWERAQRTGKRYWLVVILRTDQGIRFGGLCDPTAVLPSREVNIYIPFKNHVVSAADWRTAFDGLWQDLPFELDDDEIHRLPSP